MTWLVDIPYKVGNTNMNYKSVGYHRGAPTNHKSVWDSRFSIKEEIDCFYDAFENNWVIVKPQKTLYVGVKRNFGKIGIGKLPQKKDLSVANFKDDGGINEFHGYPIDHTVMSHKIPTNILRDWFGKEIISKTQMSRMQRCEE
jgi:hypothetical protein